VVRTLETLVADRALQVAVQEWLAARAQGSATVSSALGVIALYPAQAKLIRHLIGQNAKITGSGLKIEVGVPAEFRQREGLVVLLSLTRSHTHRAVPYGDSPAVLTLALTRACSRLILFGDAGTLARRSEWPRVLDNLDEAAAAREREVIARLVGFLQGQGRQAHVFHLREGSGT
jgi:hypothetical protein